MGWSFAKVGTLRKHGHFDHVILYETAAWYTKLKCEPGDLPVEISFTAEKWPQFAFIETQGVVIGNCHDSLWVAQVIKAHRNDRIGQWWPKVSIQRHAYNVVHHPDFTPFPEWAWLVKPYDEWGPHVDTFRQELRDAHGDAYQAFCDKYGYRFRQ